MPNAQTSTTPSAKMPLRQRIGAHPLILAAGASVAGAVVGALVPRSGVETRMLGKLGMQLNGALGALAGATRAAVSAEVAAVPVVGQLAVEQLDRVIDSVIEPAFAEPALEREPEPA